MKNANRSRRTWLIAVIGLVLVVAFLLGTKVLQFKKMAATPFVPPPETVATAKVEAVQWQASQDAIGTLVAVRGVTLGAEVAGTVREINFDSGAYVKKGQVLVKLDTSTEEAQLAAAHADASLAKLNLERALKLSEGGANTQADLDAAKAKAKQADATVASLEATIAKKNIRAPFDGRIAIRQVELGQVVSSGAPVASLQSVNPIYADFWLPQQSLATLKAGQAARMKVDIFPDATWDGQITVINPEVDPSTRNVRIRATFPNADGRLRPGMFANVQVLSSEKKPELIIPATSVIFAPYGDSVFVLQEKKEPDGQTKPTVHQKFVRVGERRGDFVAVTSGLEAGETVVSAGAFKLRNDMVVAVNNELAPKPELTPKPTDK
jgi:membrane fusion protein (multidrug efflux system)